MRWWTSDWHLNSEIVRQTSHRPWKSAEEMNQAILNMTYYNKVSTADQIIHVGDLIQSGKDRGTEIAKDKQLKWDQIICKCACQLFCIEGNHDAGNDVQFVCRSMKTRVGNYNVTVGHFPTWYEEAAGTYVSGHRKTGGYWPTVHICGHVHKAWQVQYDRTHCILNINVGIDAHKYRMLSDSDLVELIDRAYRWFKCVDTSARSFNDYSFKQWEHEMAQKKQAEGQKKQAEMLAYLKVHKPEIYERMIAKKLTKS